MSLPTRAPPNALRLFGGSCFSLIDSCDGSDALPEGKTATALRAIAINAPEGGSELAEHGQTGVLRPADNFGGLMSSRFIAPLSLILIVLFGILHFAGRRKTTPMPRAGAPTIEPAGASS